VASPEGPEAPQVGQGPCGRAYSQRGKGPDYPLGTCKGRPYRRRSSSSSVELGSSFCRLTVRTSIRSKWRSQSSRPISALRRAELTPAPLSRQPYARVSAGRPIIASTPQRHLVDRRIDANPDAAFELDLNRTRSSRRRRTLANAHRQELDCRGVGGTKASLPAPMMKQARMHVVPPGHFGDDRAGSQALLDDPRLLRRRPTTTTLTAGLRYTALGRRRLRS